MLDILDEAQSRKQVTNALYWLMSERRTPTDFAAAEHIICTLPDRIVSAHEF